MPPIPDLIIDGELQFDTVFVEAVSAAKAPDSALHGEANVFISPISTPPTSATRSPNASAARHRDRADPAGVGEAG